MIALTSHQKHLLVWIVQRASEGLLGESFMIELCAGGCTVRLTDGKRVELPLGIGTFSVLTKADFLHCVWEDTGLGLASYVVLGNAVQAVASNFAEPPVSPLVQTFSPTITGGTGFQFGNHNQMTVQMAAETIANAINGSMASPEQKEEVKGWWKRFWEHPVTKAVLEASASAAAKEIKG